MFSVFIAMVLFEMFDTHWTHLFVFCLTIYHSVIRRPNRWRLLAFEARQLRQQQLFFLPRCWSLCSVFADVVPWGAWKTRSFGVNGARNSTTSFPIRDLLVIAKATIIGWQAIRGRLHATVPNENGMRERDGLFITRNCEHLLRTLLSSLPRDENNIEYCAGIDPKSLGGVKVV